MHNHDCETCNRLFNQLWKAYIEACLARAMADRSLDAIEDEMRRQYRQHVNEAHPEKTWRQEPDPFWTGRDAATLAERQEVHPAQQLNDLRGDFWPEEEPIDDFIAAVRRWRHTGGEEE